MEADSPSRNRRPPLWATLIATALGAGLLPLAPGTWGTAAAVPLAWAVDRLGARTGFGEWIFVGVLAIVTAIGSFAADVYCKATGKHDNQQTVIDEVAGYLLTLIAVPRTWPNLVLAF